MKVISKRLLRRKTSYVENIQAERDILTKCHHPFIVNMRCSFQTREKVFIVMDFLSGPQASKKIALNEVRINNWRKKCHELMPLLSGEIRKKIKENKRKIKKSEEEGKNDRYWNNSFKGISKARHSNRHDYFFRKSP